MYKKSKLYTEMEGLRFLHSEMYQYKRYSNFLPLLASLSQVAVSLILIILPKIVLDSVQSNNKVTSLLCQITALGLILMLISVINHIFHNEISKVSQMFLFKRLKLLWEQKTINVDYDTFLSNKGKIMMEKARNVISSPNWGVVELLGKENAILESVLGLIVYSIIVCRLHIFMLVLLLLLFVIELICGLRIEKKKQKYKESRARANRRLNYMAYGTKGMKEAKDIRIFAITPYLKKMTQKVIIDQSKVESKVQLWQLCHMFITALTILLRDSISYIFLIYLFLHTEMTIGNFSLYFAAITSIGICLNKLSSSISEFTEVKNHIMDFYCFIKLQSNDGGVMPDCFSFPLGIEFDQVSFSYHIQSDGVDKKVSVINHLSFKISPGEKIAIVGINGAGKSTLIKLICGMLTPDEGLIKLNGVDISTIKRTEYYKLFSAVFQKSKLLPISIADNIKLNIKDIYKQDGDELQEEDKLWNVIRLAGMEEKVKALPEQEKTKLVKRISDNGIDLSGGQEQRLLLARALYKDAPILILDEPTSALDPISENDIYQKYNELTKGKTSFFVSHRLASTRFCDRILFLENGNIVESGSHFELMKKNGKYADMYKVQSKYYKNDEMEVM